jgi:hypothetical protein
VPSKYNASNESKRFTPAGFVLKPVMKSFNIDAILAVKERQLATVDHSTDFLEDKPIYVEASSPREGLENRYRSRKRLT